MKKVGNKGFSLIEVLIALTLLSVTVTVVLQLFSSNLRLIGSSEDYLAAVNKAEFRVREILDSDAIEEGSWTETMDNRYKMTIKITDTLKERTDYLYLRLLRVDLSVLWKSGLKEKRWTMSTLKTVNRTTPGRSVVPQ
jgi:general secretion pathway protein I